MVLLKGKWVAGWSQACRSFLFSTVESISPGHRILVPSSGRSKEPDHATMRSIGTYQVIHLVLGQGDPRPVSYKWYESLGFAWLVIENRPSLHHTQLLVDKE